MENTDIWTEGPSTSGEPKGLIGVTAGKRPLALFFPFLSLVTPLVWRRNLSKWTYSHFLQKLFFLPLSTSLGWWEFPGTIQPKRDIPAWDKDPSGRWALCTQLGATTWKCPTMFYHNYVFPYLQPEDLIQIQRVFIKENEFKDLFLTQSYSLLELTFSGNQQLI